MFKFNYNIINYSLGALFAMTLASSANAFECKIKNASMDKPGGFPDRALTMVVPYGPAGGSGQVAAAMAEAVTSLTGVSINRDHKSGGSGTVGMTAYMAMPADGYSVLDLSGNYMTSFLDNDLNLFWRVSNVFDKEYYDHLSRLKTAGIHEMGRNISVGLKYNF